MTMKLVTFDSLGVFHLDDPELLDLVCGGSQAEVGLNPKCDGRGAYKYEGVNGNCGAANSTCPTNAYCLSSIDWVCNLNGEC